MFLIAFTSLIFSLAAQASVSLVPADGQSFECESRHGRFTTILKAAAAKLIDANGTIVSAIGGREISSPYALIMRTLDSGRVSHQSIIALERVNSEKNVEFRGLSQNIEFNLKGNGPYSLSLSQQSISTLFKQGSYAFSASPALMNFVCIEDRHGETLNESHSK